MSVFSDSCFLNGRTSKLGFPGVIGFLRDVATAAADFGNGSDPEA